MPAVSESFARKRRKAPARAAQTPARAAASTPRRAPQTAPLVPAPVTLDDDGWEVVGAKGKQKAKEKQQRKQEQAAWEKERLAAARTARDAAAAAEQKSPSPAATVTAGFDLGTGKVAVGRSGRGHGCAEGDVVFELRQSGLEIRDSDVRFTEAVRPTSPRGGGRFTQVPVCTDCQKRFGVASFPPGVMLGTTGRQAAWNRKQAKEKVKEKETSKQ